MDEAPRIEELTPDGIMLAQPRGSGGHVAAVRLGGIPSTVVRSAVLVAILVALAVAKPWSPPGSERSAASPPGRADTTAGISAAVASRAPSPAGVAAVVADGTSSGGGVGEPPPASALPPGAVGCGTPRSWRLVTVGRLAGRPVEGLSVIDPVAGAVGPTDPRIPVLPAGQAPLAAAGACRPLATASVADDRTDRPPALVVGAWRLVGRAADPLPLIERGPAAATAAAAQLYAPAGSPGGGWGPGRYVLEVRVGDLSATAWLGFEVTPPAASAP